MGATANSDPAAGKICPSCHYQRRINEPVPDWLCPQCQIVYAKYTPVSPPTDEPVAGKKTPDVIIREELYARGQGSPWPWLILILLVVGGSGLYLYDYLRWPDRDIITLFTSDSCGNSCLQARSFLQQQGVSFIEKNIDRDPDHRARWKRAGGNQVPLAFFGEERIEGFNRTIYRIALTGFKDRMQDNLNQTVILFTAADCSGCENAVKLLQKHRIEFEEYDIKEPENESVYRELFGRGTPLIFVGNIRLDGYSEEALKLALGQVDLL